MEKLRFNLITVSLFPPFLKGGLGGILRGWKILTSKIPLNPPFEKGEIVRYNFYVLRK